MNDNDPTNSTPPANCKSNPSDPSTPKKDPPQTCIPCALIFDTENAPRITATRQRLKEVNTLLATLDGAFETAAARNVAVSATPFYDAWHNVNARAKVARSFTLREIDALLDGDVAEADSCRRCRDVAAHAMLARMDAFEEELERFALEN